MSIFRNTVWFIKGMREYTKNGFVSASKSFNEKDLEVDVTGRSFMITGANSGIGKCAAIEIAKRGGTIHMVCRDQKRGEEALNEIKSTSGNSNIKLHQLDMSLPSEVLKFTKNFEKSGEKLNVLINNAGCMINEQQLTEEGYDKNFATNTLGTHILTVGLTPVLLNSEDPRVIIVTSGGMLVQKLNIQDLQCFKLKPYDGTMVYAQNKRQQVVMAEQYKNRYPTIHFSCMHPGWADTPAVRSAMPDFYEKMKDRLRTAEQGADTLIWLAVRSNIHQLPSGEFFQDRQVVNKHLPLAWTKTSDTDNLELMSVLDKMMQALPKD
ncbi:hypothetical protein LOTGIDRAFT_195174 [Lottia gigantea]|uniref:Dehydrogenase/reductase SDR family member 12 n=1 Tax=Lottia gigantea TaxID=225164 RepID=V4BDE2_LOTGI|nr:hypothetical protein LOTGIDRAFT_195174 [Lottia gigantea]ESO86444.1 hypothetical protein LOTGIDRAFT_195174 [Lottia gigantea]